MSHMHRYGTDRLRTSRAEGYQTGRGERSIWPVIQHGSLLVKADRPRQIDPYIDYFGGGTRSTRPLRVEMGRAG
jgi:hypothetical protein